MKNIVLGFCLLSLVGCGIPSYYVLSNWDDADTKSRAYAVGVTILTLGINPLIGYVRVRSSGTEFETHEVSPKDLERVGAKIERLGVERLARDISQRFELSYESSRKISKGISYFNRVSKQRSLRNKEIEDLYKFSLGLATRDITMAIKDFREGNQNGIDRFLQKLADYHHTSPEHIRFIIEDNFLPSAI